MIVNEAAHVHRLTVNLKAPAAGEAAALRSSDVVGRLRASGNDAVQRRLSKASAVVTKAAKYDYTELQAYRGRLKKIFSVRGVHELAPSQQHKDNRSSFQLEPPP